MNSNPTAEPTPNQPLDKAQAVEEKGVSGTLVFQGIITSEEYNANLIGTKGYKTYDIMRRSDSTIRQALQIVKLPIQSTTWDIEPFRDKEGNVSDKAQTVADFVKSQILEGRFSFDQLVKEALNCFDFGFSVFEKVYIPVKWNGKTYIGLEKIASRKQVSIVRWETPDGEAGVTQQVSGKTVGIPRNKLVVFTYDLEGENWEGISLLRSIYKDWDIKDKLVLVNAMALEKHGMGMPVVRERDNQTASPEDQAEAERTLSNVRANEQAYMKIPSTMEVEMMDMKGSTTKEIIPTLNYHDGRIMAGVLARFMELGGASGTGSQALSTDLSSIFMKAEETFAKQFGATILNDVIKQLCDLNFADMESVGYPTLTFGSIGDDDTVALANSLNQLGQSGFITPDPEIEDNLRRRYRLPEMSQEMREQYERDIAEGAMPGGQNTEEVIQAARKRFKETKDPKEALIAARDMRDLLVEQLNGA